MKNKGLMVTLVIFAIIGMLTVVAGIGFGGYMLFNRTKATVTAKLEDVKEASNTVGLEENTVLKPEETVGETKEENKEETAQEPVKQPDEEVKVSLTENDNVSAQTDEDNPANLTLRDDVDLPTVIASTEEDKEDYEENKLNIVFLGDSIIDNFRDETGIVYLVGQGLDANVYNLGIGGISASAKRDFNYYSDEAFTPGEACGVVISKVLAGQVSQDVLPDCTAKDIIAKHLDEIRQADLYVVEYGINDFLAGRNQNNPDDNRDIRTYEGALRMIINCLRKANPNAKIVVTAPSYAEFYRPNGEYIGNSYTLDDGLGSMADYGNKAEYVSGSMDCYFFSLDRQGVGFDNSFETMLDSVHLNAKGREIYASNFIPFLRKEVLGMEE